MSSEKMSTRTRILKAAWEMLDSNPGVAAKMSDIAKKAGVSEAYFDRGGFLFHGKVKAVADAAREGGLKI